MKLRLDEEMKTHVEIENYLKTHQKVLCLLKTLENKTHLTGCSTNLSSSTVVPSWGTNCFHTNGVKGKNTNAIFLFEKVCYKGLCLEI